MYREQNNGLHFGENNTFRLIRHLSLWEGKDIDESYVLEDEKEEKYLEFTPAELAELRAAIDEMLRMRGQHIDALMDGAGPQIPQPENWGDPFKEGRLCGEQTAAGMAKAERERETKPAGPAQTPEPNAAQILEILAALAKGERMDEDSELFSQMRQRELIALVSGGYYAISAKGRALLDAQTPEADLTAGEADPVSADDISLLRKLSEGVTLELGHSARPRFCKRGWVDVTEETGACLTSDWEYGITDKGRRALDAQETEAEDELDVTDLAILQDLAEPGERLISVEGGSGLIWGLSGKDSSFTHNYLSLLYKRKLIHFASAEEQTEDLRASYHISDAGRAVLAEQEG